MNRNIRSVDAEMPAYHIAKRARLDQLAHEAQARPSGLHAGLWVFVVFLLGVCVLVWGRLQGWWA